MDTIASLLSSHNITFDPLELILIYVMAGFKSELSNLKLAIAVLQSRVNTIAPEKTPPQ